MKTRTLMIVTVVFILTQAAYSFITFSQLQAERARYDTLMALSRKNLAGLETTTAALTETLGYLRDCRERGR